MSALEEEEVVDFEEPEQDAAPAQTDDPSSGNGATTTEAAPETTENTEMDTSGAEPPAADTSTGDSDKFDPIKAPSATDDDQRESALGKFDKSLDDLIDDDSKKRKDVRQKREKKKGDKGRGKGGGWEQHQMHGDKGHGKGGWEQHQPHAHHQQHQHHGKGGGGSYGPDRGNRRGGQQQQQHQQKKPSLSKEHREHLALSKDSRVEQKSDGMAVRLHATDVLVAKNDNTVVMDTGGYKTIETLFCINQALKPLGLRVIAEDAPKESKKDDEVKEEKDGDAAMADGDKENEKTTAENENEEEKEKTFEDMAAEAAGEKSNPNLGMKTKRWMIVDGIKSQPFKDGEAVKPSLLETRRMPPGAFASVVEQYYTQMILNSKDEVTMLRKLEARRNRQHNDQNGGRRGADRAHPYGGPPAGYAHGPPAGFHPYGGPPPGYGLPPGHHHHYHHHPGHHHHHAHHHHHHAQHHGYGKGGY